MIASEFPEASLSQLGLSDQVRKEKKNRRKCFTLDTGDVQRNETSKLKTEAH